MSTGVASPLREGGRQGCIAGVTARAKLQLVKIERHRCRPRVRVFAYPGILLGCGGAEARATSLFTTPIYASRPPAMSKVFSLQGKGLKLDTRADIEPYLKDVPTTIEEIHLGGNTIGVEAAEALAEFLAKTTHLRVRSCVLLP